jgi:hypothetical protein
MLNNFKKLSSYIYEGRGVFCFIVLKQFFIQTYFHHLVTQELKCAPSALIALLEQIRSTKEKNLLLYTLPVVSLLNQTNQT